MTAKTNIPDFFIVGAPKCGTTALDHHLSQHPEIFMAKKELHYFGKDLGMKQDELTKEGYLAHFTEAGKLRKGESSVWYLYSKTAAQEIKAFNPEARIIIMLRRPDEMIPSLHGQFIYDADLAETNFELAFQQDLNRENQPIPCFNFENRPKFLEAASYSEQVKRYLDIFGKKQVLIVLHEDLKLHFEATYRKVLDFIGVSTDFIPDQKQVNARKDIKNVSLHHMSKEPPKGLRRVFRFVVPYKPLRHKIMQQVEHLNVSEQQASSVSPEMKLKINDLLKTDVLSLQQLIARDLSGWLK
ncbi:MAG: sulfotransferase [Flavobacteriales bacterium]|nr:sulfotransferase [Flavobacteriales bacterium]